mgnify:CR=1 FL=1
MEKTSYYSLEELHALGFQSVGKQVLVSRKASIYGVKRMSLGNHVRIDDFCILSGRIKLGDYVHIGAYTGLFAGDAGIEMHDFSSTSSRCVIYAESDDYSGESLTNPTIPDQYKELETGKIVVGRHVILGTGTSLLPGVTIGEGTAVGAMSLVVKPLEPWGIYVGVPCKRIGERKKTLLKKEEMLLIENTAAQKSSKK